VPLRFGYGTNGFADHRIEDVVAVVAGLGYDGLALTLDHQHLDPFGADLARQVARVRDLLAASGLAVVIETGARYLLDPRRKHAPTLISPRNRDRERRLELLRRAVRVGADLGAEAVSFFSGTAPAGVPASVSWDLLVDGCAAVVDAAREAGVRIGFEPEPGMMVENLDGYLRLRDLLGAPAVFGLTLDIGHCRCLEPASVPEVVRRSAEWVVNVQIEDMRRGIHEHLEFGYGEIDFPPVLDALVETGYRGLVSVELPRHSHAAPEVARRSLAFLRHAGAVGAGAARTSTRPHPTPLTPLRRPRFPEGGECVSSTLTST
jgi:sugar phosphate isomerase/epimerase